MSLSFDQSPAANSEVTGFYRLLENAPLMVGMAELHDSNILLLQTDATHANYFDLGSHDADARYSTEIEVDASVIKLWVKQATRAFETKETVRFDYTRKTLMGDRHFMAVINPDITQIHDNRFSYFILDLTQIEADSESLRSQTHLLKDTVAQQGLVLRQTSVDLDETESRFQATFESASVGMAMVDASGRYVRVNQRLCEITGYSFDELMNRTDESITHRDDQERNRELRMQFAAGIIESYEFEKRFVHKNGNAIWVSINRSAMSDSEDERRFSIEVIQDIDEKVRLKNFLADREDRLQMVLKTSHVAAWDWNPQTDEVVRMINGLEIFGSNIRNFSDFSEVISEHDRIEMKNSIDRSVNLAIPLKYKTKVFHRASGETRWLETFANSFQYEGGSVVRLGGITVDVTEGERVAEALQESGKMFRSLAETLPNLVWKSSAFGDMTYFNHRWTDYTGASVERLCGTGWMSYLHPDDVDPANALWAKAVSTGTMLNVEYRLRGSNGEYRWFLCRATPQVNSQGTILKWFGSLTDIEEQVKSRKVIEEALSLRDRFLSIAGHEMRTPLTSLKIHLQLLGDQSRIEPGSLSTKAQGLVDIANRQLDQLGRLTENLLDLSRIQLGRMNFFIESASLADVTAEILERFRPNFQERGQKLSLKVLSDSQVDVDRGRYEQVLTNLLTNCLKYAPQSNVVIEINRLQDHPTVQVSDSGPGIPPTLATGIFDAYVGEPSLKRSGGLGLGLYISQKLIEGMAGSLHLVPTKKGAKFLIQFPLKTKV